MIKNIGHNESELLNEWHLHQIIISFSNLGQGKAALDVFNNFELLGVVPNEDTYYFTIKALCRTSVGYTSKDYRHACYLYKKMLDGGCLPTTERIGDILCWLCARGMVEEAYDVYQHAKEKEIRSMNWFDFLVECLCQEIEPLPTAFDMLNDIPEEEREQLISHSPML